MNKQFSVLTMFLICLSLALLTGGLIACSEGSDDGPAGPGQIIKNPPLPPLQGTSPFPNASPFPNTSPFPQTSPFPGSTAPPQSPFPGGSPFPNSSPFG